MTLNVITLKKRREKTQKLH